MRFRKIATVIPLFAFPLAIMISGTSHASEEPTSATAKVGAQGSSKCNPDSEVPNANDVFLRTMNETEHGLHRVTSQKYWKHMDGDFGSYINPGATHQWCAYTPGGESPYVDAKWDIQDTGFEVRTYAKVPSLGPNVRSCAVYNKTTGEKDASRFTCASSIGAGWHATAKFTVKPA